MPLEFGNRVLRYLGLLTLLNRSSTMIPNKRDDGDEIDRVSTAERERPGFRQLKALPVVGRVTLPSCRLNAQRDPRLSPVSRASVRKAGCPVTASSCW